MNPQRILFASTLAAHWAGSEWLWSDAALRLRQAGHTVGYLQPWSKDHPSLTALRQAGAIEYNAMAPVPWHKRWWPRSGARQPFFAQALAEFRPDLLVISQARQEEGLDWIPHLRASGVRYALVNHLVIDAPYLEDATADRIIALYQGAQQVFFVSEASRATVEMQLGIGLPGASVVRNPVRVPLDESALPPWPSGPEIRLGLAGRLDPDQKGHDVMFQVLARPKWKERPIALHLFGHGSAEQRLRRLAKMLDLDRVVFAGYVNSPRDIWQQCQVVSMASRQEGLPIAMVEGMLLARPVLGTRIAGIPEFVTEGVEGFLAEACVPSAVDAALERLWQARSDLPAMGRAARAKALALAGTDPAGAFAMHLTSLLRART